MPQIESEIDKNSKSTDFQRFYTIYVKFLIVFEVSNVEEIQTGQNSVIQEAFWKK